MKISKRPLRVVALLENHSYPTDARVRPHMEALAASDYEVTVISMRGRGQPWHESINGVRVHRFFLPAYGNTVGSYFLEFLHATIALTWMTLWVWFRYGLDILCIYNPPDTLFLAALLPRLAGKRVIFDLRDLSPELYVSKYEHPNRALYHTLVWIEGVACRLGHRVITVNESYRSIIVKRAGVIPEKVSVIRQGPDLTRVHPAEPDPEVRAHAGIIIAYLGSMANEDGIDHLLRALHSLEHQFGKDDWHCVLVGPSANFKELNQLASDLGISSRVCFTGYQRPEQWIRTLSAADICVEPAPANPVNNISTTNKIMDYMALGKPCVGYGLSEQRITADGAALYASPNDPEDLARQIARLIENPSLRAELGTRGMRRVEEQLAWQRQRERFLSLWASITEDLSLQQGS